MMNSKMMREEDVMSIEPHPHSFFSDIFTQTAQVAIKLFEKQEKQTHHLTSTETLIQGHKLVQEQQQQKLMEDDDKRAGTKLVINEEEFMARAYNRSGRNPATTRLADTNHSPSKDNFIKQENLTKREKFEERLRRERTLKRPIMHDDDEYASTKPNKNKKQKKAAKRPSTLVPEKYYIPDLPAYLENAIKSLNGTRVKFLIEKELTHTDVSIGHNRLSIMQRQCRDHGFLTQEEKKFLNTRIGTKPAGMRVILIEPSGEKGEITFKKWDLNNNLQWVFITEWKHICENNELIRGVVVRVWTFRTPDGKLGFALAKV